MNCFVYFFHVSKPIFDTNLFEPSSYYMRICVRPECLTATLFRTDENRAIEELFEQPIPYCAGDRRERSFYWQNLGDRLRGYQIDELHLHDAFNNLTHEIREELQGFAIVTD